jgi:hypothetical protein
MTEIVAFHFLMLAAGEVLKFEKYVTAQKVQDCIQNDDAFGVRIPLEECRLALQLLENSGFIIKETDTKDKEEPKYYRATMLMVADKWH